MSKRTKAKLRVFGYAGKLDDNEYAYLHTWLSGRLERKATHREVIEYANGTRNILEEVAI